MRQLEHIAEHTKRKLNANSASPRAAAAVASMGGGGVNFGAAGQRLAAIGGFGRMGAMVGAIGALGPLGLGVAAIGAGVFAGAAAANQFTTATASIAGEHTRALEALRQNRILGGTPISRSGFTEFGAQRMASGQTPGPMVNAGFTRGLALGMGGGDSFARRLVELAPVAAGAFVGARLSGETEARAVQSVGGILGPDDSLRVVQLIADAYLTFQRWRWGVTQ